MTKCVRKLVAASFAMGIAAACIGACARAEHAPPATPRADDDVAGKKAREPSLETRPADVPTSGSSVPDTSTTTATPSPTPPKPPAKNGGAAPPADEPKPTREAALRSARSEVEQAQRELDLAMSTCTSACKALGSMERATGHLCELASEHDDRAHCEDAKASVLKARAKIKATCGSCPGGPSLERGAPIPSR